MIGCDPNSRSIKEPYTVVKVFIIGLTVFVLGACSERRSWPSIEEFQDAGVQMELPAKPSTESISAKGVLVAFHPGRVVGFADEQEYMLKIYVERVSQVNYDSQTLWTTNLPLEDFSRWDNGSHSNLDVRKEKAYYNLRRDVKAPSGEFLVIRGELYITNSVEEDLAEAQRIVQSVKALR
jgi:hypothetical protein